MQNGMSGARAATPHVRTRRLDLGGGVTAVILDRPQAARSSKTTRRKALAAKQTVSKRKTRSPR